LGRLDYNLRRYPEAVTKLQKALELAPQSARGWDSLGLAFDMQGQLEQAYGAFTKAAALNRGLPQPSAWPPHDLGYLCLRMNKLKQAENSLREALRYDQKLAVAHYHLARVLEGEAQEHEAVAEYKAAISEDSFSTDACYSLAMLYRRLHQEDEAAAMFTEYKRRKEALPEAALQPQ
jgi:tetratricopeptide (TPR) repeat protein